MTERLSPDVTATLRALLVRSDPVSVALRSQIPWARVVGRCGCGCAIVDLDVDRGDLLGLRRAGHHMAGSPLHRALNNEARAPATGVGGYPMLFASGGRITDEASR